MATLLLGTASSGNIVDHQIPVSSAGLFATWLCCTLRVLVANLGLPIASIWLSATRSVPSLIDNNVCVSAVQTFNVHTDSVWCLLASESFNVVLSGGRDKCIYRTNLSHRTSELLLVEQQPIRKMVRFCSFCL